MAGAVVASCRIHLFLVLIAGNLNNPGSNLSGQLFFFSSKGVGGLRLGVQASYLLWSVLPFIDKIKKKIN